MSSNNLWLLIRSMNANEKRFFRRNYVSYDRAQPTPLYLRVFDLLSKQETYDEQQLLVQLRPELKNSNVSYIKNYLYEHIGIALLELKQQSDPQVKLHQQVQLIKILREKGLFKQALKIWQKAIKQARTLELFATVLQLKEEYQHLQLYNNQKIKLPDLKVVYEDVVMYYSDYAEMLKLQEIYFSALLLRRRTHFNLSKTDRISLQKLLADPLLETEPAVNSFRFKHLFLLSKSTLLYLSGDYKSYPLALKNMKLWQSKPSQVTLDPDNYYESLYIFYYTAILANDISEIEAVMNHKINKQLADTAQQYYFESLKFLALNRVFNRSANYKSVKSLIEHNLPLIDKWSEFVNIEQQRTVHLSAGLACFALELLDDAFYHIKQSLLLFNDQSRAEQISFAHLFLLVICHEKKEDFLFDLQLKSTYAFFYQKKRPFIFVKDIYHLLGKTYYSRSRQERTSLFNELLEKLNQEAEQEVKTQVFQFFNFPAWIESKINNVRYRDWIVLKKQKDA